MAKTKVHGEFLKDSVVRFTAKAGENITKGQAVYISGISGEVPVVSLADANDTAKMPAFGLAEATVSTNAEVEITSFGTLKGLDTSTPGYSLGDILYVDTTAGSLTNNPSGLEATKLQNIGMVQRVHATSGSIKVGGAGRTNAVPNLDDGDIFIGDSNNKAVSDSFTNILNSEAGINSSADATAITIDSSERVGIGTSSPAQALVVNRSSGNTYLDISRATQSQGQVALQLTGGTGGTNWIMYQDTSSDDLRFFGNSSNRMTINTSGNVGIGENNPTMGLHVADTKGALFGPSGSGASTYISPAHENTINGGYGLDNDTGDLWVNYRGYQNGTSRFRDFRVGNGKEGVIAFFDGSSGNVGIGTTSPAYKLEVESSSDADLIQIQSTASANNTVLRLGISGDVATLNASGGSSGALAIKTYGSERMRIDSSGRLLVGTTSTTPAFGANTGIALVPTGESMLSANSTTALFLNRTTSDGSILDFRKNGTQVGSISASTNLNIGSGGTRIWFRDGTKALRPVSTEIGNGSDGIINIGEVGGRFKDLYLSGGAYLGGTGAANHLDDYEEGTWTPAYTTGSHTYTTASTRGVYTKIGDCITFSGVITTSSLTQSGNHVRLSLPFTALSEQANFVPVSLFVENGYNPSGGAGNMQGIVTSGQTDIQLYTVASSTGNNYTQVTFNDLKVASGTRIRFSGHYYV